MVILARRTRKARRNSVCPSCSTPITVGQSIALVDQTWSHTRCVVAAQKNDQAPQQSDTRSNDLRSDQQNADAHTARRAAGARGVGA